MSLELTPDAAYQVGALLRYAAGRGYRVRLTSGYRTCAAQNAIYEGGAGTATLARGCQSWHTQGRAVDLEIEGGSRAAYADLGEWWEARGGVWGGRFTGLDDPGHFEWHPGLTIQGTCPDPSAACLVPPWPEDRPWHRRPAAQALLGAGLGLGVVRLVYMLAKR